MAVETVVIATAIPLAAPAPDDSRRQKQQPFHDPTQATSSSCSMLPYILVGIVTGFSIQLVSLGAYALLLIRDNSNATIATATSDEEVTATIFPGVAASTSSPFSLSFSIVTFVVESLTTSEGTADALLAPPSRPQMWTTTHNTHNSVLHTLLCLFSQLDIVVYVMIWIAFTWTMTKQGMIRCCRRRSSTTTTTNTTSSSSSSRNNNNQDRRAIFRCGVYFLGGIVIGAFIAWSMIDLYLQFPIPLTPIVLTVLLDLLLCYGMLVCYDLGNSSTTPTQLHFHDDEDGDGETYEEERG